MNENLIAFAICGLFVAGIIKGATGIGYSSCALPFLVASLGLKAAIVLLVVPAMASNVAVLFTTGSLEFALKRFGPSICQRCLEYSLALLCSSGSIRVSRHRSLVSFIAAYAIQAWLKPSFVLQPKIAHGGTDNFGGPLEWAADRLHWIAGHAAHAIYDVLETRGRTIRTSSEYRRCDRFDFLDFGLLGNGHDVGPGARSLRLGRGAGLFGVQLGTWARRHIPAAHFRSLVLAVCCCSLAFRCSCERNDFAPRCELSLWTLLMRENWRDGPKTVANAPKTHQKHGTGGCSQ